MRRVLIATIARVFVVLLAVGVYLYFLPVEITSGANGVSINFPIFIRLTTAQSGVNPVHWNYVLLLPVSLLILFIGFELIRLLDRR